MKEAETRTAARGGRSSATTRGELGRIGLDLMLERGFDAVTVDDIAAAAGIGRRTFFRYFRSKNDVPWGDFASLLDSMRVRFAEVPRGTPIAIALRDAVVDFNDFPAEALPHHRRRMSLLLGTPTLVAYSALQYAEWRETVARFVAGRLRQDPSQMAPQTAGRVCLGITLAAYEQWLADEGACLTGLIHEGFDHLAVAFSPDVVAGSGRP